MPVSVEEEHIFFVDRFVFLHPLASSEALYGYARQSMLLLLNHPMLEPLEEDNNGEQFPDNVRGVSHPPSIEHHQNHEPLLELLDGEEDLYSQHEQYTNHPELQPEVLLRPVDYHAEDPCKAQSRYL